MMATELEKCETGVLWMCLFDRQPPYCSMLVRNIAGLTCCTWSRETMVLILSM
jgi:hypothetical protein